MPLNLTSDNDVVDYLVTGSWSKKAIQEAKRYLPNTNNVATGDNKSIPPTSDWRVSNDAKYFYYCDNETI